MAKQDKCTDQKRSSKGGAARRSTLKSTALVTRHYDPSEAHQVQALRNVLSRGECHPANDEDLPEETTPFGTGNE